MQTYGYGVMLQSIYFARYKVSQVTYDLVDYIDNNPYPKTNMGNDWYTNYVLKLQSPYYITADADNGCMKHITQPSSACSKLSTTKYQ